jgi:hypothetical protein
MQADLQKWGRSARIKLLQAKYSYLSIVLSSGEEGQWAEDIMCSACVFARVHTCFTPPCAPMHTLVFFSFLAITM